MRSFLIFMLGLSIFTVSLFILSPGPIFSINAVALLGLGKQSLIVIRVIGGIGMLISTLIMMSQV